MAVAPAPESLRIRPRAIVTGVLLIPFASWWIFEGEMVRYTFATWAAPFYNAVYILFFLALGNLLYARIRRRPYFNPLELLSIYTMVSVASAMVSSDLLGILITLMGFPTRFASSENRWDTLFPGNLPDWLMVRDEKALRGFYEGQSTFWKAEHIHAWLVPSLWWMLYAAALFTAFLALANLLRKQWEDAERLTFPIVQVPLAVATEPAALLTHRLFWIGFLLAGGITLMNGMHVLAPSIPELPIKRHKVPLFDVAPWNAVPQVSVSFYFFAITLGFLMPLDLSFSIWFFFFLYLAEQIASAAAGFQYFETFKPADRSFGAFMTIGAMALWGARKHLANALRSAFGRRDSGDDDGEGAGYRLTLIALGASLLFMFGFMVKGGMTPLIAALSLLILMALGVVITRIRTELGFPVHDLHNMGPHDVLTRLIGQENIPQPTLGALSLFYWHDRVFRSHPMPHIMEGLRLGGDGAAARRDMLKAIALAGLLAIPVAFAVYLTGFYKMGASSARACEWATGYGWETFGRLQTWLTDPLAASHGKLSMVFSGASVAGALAFARLRIVGFPLHPLGFAVATSWGVWYLWTPILVGWVCKFVTLRIGGLRFYRDATMLFFGLMLGEFVVGCSWTLLGMAFNVKLYDFWP